MTYSVDNIHTSWEGLSLYSCLILMIVLMIDLSFQCYELFQTWDTEPQQHCKYLGLIVFGLTSCFVVFIS